jgi:hypothetical protein
LLSGSGGRLLVAVGLGAILDQIGLSWGEEIET